MMYSRADKIRIFRKLQNPKMGECDLRLLAHQAPQHTELAKFRRNPTRYANDILYALIDVTTEQAITENRNSENRSETHAPAPAEPKTRKAPAKKTTDAKKKPSKKKTSTHASTGRT